MLLRSSAGIFHGRDYGPVWVCRPCGARVGCHKGTTRPLGSPCNTETRLLRTRAHALFDGLWRRKMARDGCSKKRARSAAYRWLADMMALPPERTHIGMMDAAACQRVIDICGPFQSHYGSSQSRPRTVTRDITQTSPRQA